MVTDRDIEDAVAAALHGEQTILRDSAGEIVMVVGLGSETFEWGDDFINTCLDVSGDVQPPEFSWFD